MDEIRKIIREVINEIRWNSSLPEGVSIGKTENGDIIVYTFNYESE